MPTSFRPYLPNQGMPLPADLREWVPEDHLARQVSDLVESPDLSAFYSPYEGDGRRNAPYEPAMMVKILIYAYATGTFSSRRIARKIEEDVAFRMLAAGNFPRHRTVCEFRRRHLDDFRALFVDVVRVARAMGLASFGSLSVDGTKVRANASKRKAMSCARMKKEEERIEKEVGELLAAARRTGDGEDEIHGEDVRGDEVPEALCGGERRLAAIREAKARLDAEAREAPPRQGTKVAPAPAPAAPAADLSLELCIRERRLETIRASRARLEEAARAADAGRKCPPAGRAIGEPLPKAQSDSLRPESRIMKTSAEGFQQCHDAQLAVDEENQVVVATHLGQGASDQNRLVPLLDEVEETFGVMPERALADAGYCNEAELARLEERGVDACVALARDGSKRPAADAFTCRATGRMAEKLATPEGKARYARRKWLSEAPNGWIKEAMGFRRFSVQGLAKARGEWNLVCLAEREAHGGLGGRLTGRQRGIPGGIPFLEGPEEGPWA